MPELTHQLRAYYEATTEPVDVEAIVRSERPTLRVIDADHPHAEGDLPPAGPPSSPRRSGVMAAAAVAAAIALGAGLYLAGTRADRSPEPADQPPAVATTTPTIDEDGTLVGAIEDLGIASRSLEPGRYGTGLLGVEVAFDVPTPMLLASTRAGVVVISDGVLGDLGFPPTAQGWTPDEVVEIRLMRISGWSTRDEATLVDPEAASIDPNDIDAWVAANDVTITSDDQIVVAGRTARVVDVEVDADSTVRAKSCFDDHQPCFLAASIAGDEDGLRNREVQVSGAVSQRIFVVPIEGFEPLVIIVAAPTGSEWLDVLQTEIVASLHIGPDAAPIGAE